MDKILVTIFLLITFSVMSFADVYKWTDEYGRVHFGDSQQDQQKGERVEIKVYNSYENVSYENIEFYKTPKGEKVIMYSTVRCRYCKQARAYFEENNIAYTDYDIEKNEEAKAFHKKIGAKGVPVIIVGKKMMRGFSVDGFENLYK